MRALSYRICLALVIGKSGVTSVLGLLEDRALINEAFFVCNYNTSKAYCRKDKQICDTSSGAARCVCADGWGGKRCEDDIDECAENYPCPGVKNVNSICIDRDPPIRFECKCLRGYKPVYLESDQSDDVNKFHPVDCIKANICDNNPCHPDATCFESSSESGFDCLCNKGLIGDGVVSCSVTPSVSPSSMVPTNKPTSPPVTKDKPLDSYCTQSSDCTVLNAHCVLGVCACQEGFARRKSECININECEAGYLNNCHRNADCSDTLGGYECQCKDGFQDRDISSQPGLDCIQTNECLEGNHTCDIETEVCIDRRPPLKWECTLKTAAPTRQPTRKFVPPVPRCDGVRKLQVAPTTPAPVTLAPFAPVTLVNPIAVTPTAVAPTAVTPTAVTPTAVTPTAVTPTAVTPTAVTPTAATPAPVTPAPRIDAPIC